MVRQFWLDRPENENDRKRNFLGLRYMVSGTRDNPPPEEILWKRFPHRPSQTWPCMIIHNPYYSGCSEGPAESRFRSHVNVSCRDFPQLFWDSSVRGKEIIAFNEGERFLIRKKLRFWGFLCMVINLAPPPPKKIFQGLMTSSRCHVLLILALR